MTRFILRVQWAKVWAGITWAWERACNMGWINVGVVLFRLGSGLVFLLTQGPFLPFNESLGVGFGIFPNCF